MRLVAVIVKVLDKLSNEMLRGRYTVLPNKIANVAFVPKDNRTVICGEKKQETGKILRELCERKDTEIIEANARIDHICMLLKIPSKMSASYFMGYMNGKVR